MIIDLNDTELNDVRRALVIAMQNLDLTGNPPDMLLSNRLEIIQQRLNEIEN